MTKATRPTPKKKPNPYLGFGWVGWVGVVVFVALATVPILGIDPIYSFYHWMAFDQGAGGRVVTIHYHTYWLVAPIIRPWMHFAPPTAAIMIAIILWSPLEPRRKRALVAMLIFLSLAQAAMESTWFYWGETFPIGRIQIGPFWIWTESALVHALVVVGVAAALWSTTRSAWLARSVFALGVFGLTGQLGPVIWNHPLWKWVEFSYHDIIIGPNLIWNAALIATMMTWAIREHRRPPHCPSCEYDLTNLPSTICPECGEDVSAVLARSTATGRSVGGQNV